eukprot:gene16945-11139_t
MARHLLPLATLPLLATLASLAAGTAGCASDKDCNYSGCTTGACHCDPPFHGDACETFSLYSYKPGQGGLLMPGGNTTWGGAVVEADDGTHHMYAAMMSDNLTLSSWLSHSVVAHAVSTSGPAGPYTFADVALGPRGGEWWDAVTCHNPDAKRTPDGTYVIYRSPPEEARSVEHAGGMYEGVAAADSFRGPYTKLTPNAPMDIASSCEDAGIYRTNGG